MKRDEQERMEMLLREAMPQVGSNVEPGRDLWPTMLRRMSAQAAAVPWFDWALLAGLVGLAAMAPASIPVLLYNF